MVARGFVHGTPGLRLRRGLDATEACDEALGPAVSKKRRLLQMGCPGLTDDGAPAMAEDRDARAIEVALQTRLSPSTVIAVEQA